MLSNTNISKHDFRISNVIDEISMQGVSWTWDLQNSLKIRENAENVSPGLWIPLHPNTM